MTLSFSHGGPNIGYIGFGAFRRMLALHEGINLDEMEGYSPRYGLASSTPKKSWKGVKARLRPLYDHSDCSGYLTPGTCLKLVQPLRVFTHDVFGPASSQARINKDNPYVVDWAETVRSRDKFYFEFGMDLAAAMECAGKLNENLEFE